MRDRKAITANRMCHSQSPCQLSYLDENLSYLLLIYHYRSGSNIHIVERVLFQFGSANKLCSCQPQKITVFFFIGVQLDYSIWLVNLIHLIAKKFQSIIFGKLFVYHRLHYNFDQFFYFTRPFFAFLLSRFRVWKPQ